MAVRPMSKKEIAAAYNVSAKTLWVWMKRFDIQVRKNAKIYTIIEVQEIYNKLGQPF